MERYTYPTTQVLSLLKLMVIQCTGMSKKMAQWKPEAWTSTMLEILLALGHRAPRKERISLTIISILMVNLFGIWSIMSSFLSLHSSVSVCLFILPSFSQSVSQSINPSVSWSGGRSVSQSVSLSALMSVSQLVCRLLGCVGPLVKQLGSQSGSPSVCPPVCQAGRAVCLCFSTVEMKLVWPIIMECKIYFYTFCFYYRLRRRARCC